MKSTLDLNDYILQEEIGSGSFGEVHKVADKKTGEIYAAKIAFKPLKENSTSDIRSFSREVNILSQINHPAILKFIGFSSVDFSNKPFPVIITEYISNGSLSDIINLERNSKINSNWNDTRKLITIFGIASAMSYLHSHNIIHRDLKPANILVDNFLCPKVADFGLSKVTHSNEESIIASQSTAGIKGTPIYIAPEIWMEKEYTTACDVYAFGIIVYEIITSLVPYHCKFQFEIITKIINGDRPAMDDSVPSSYRNLIERCWSKNPDDRPTFDQIVEEIKTDKSFITSNVKEADFLDYVDFLEKSPKNFKENEKIIQIDQYLKHKSTTFVPIKINDLSISSSTSGKKSSLFPLKKFKALSKECQAMVEEAEDDPEKQFDVGESLIKGINDFPLNVEIGIRFIEKSAKNGYLDSIVYYSQLLIDDEIIPQDLEKAKKILNDHPDEDDPKVSLMYGKILKKEEKFEDAMRYFEMAAKAGNKDAMYECGKLLYKGVGCTKNEKEAKKYFAIAKRNGCEKSDKFLSKHEKNSNDKGDEAGKSEPQNQLQSRSISQQQQNTTNQSQQLNQSLQQPSAPYQQQQQQNPPNSQPNLRYQLNNGSFSQPNIQYQQQQQNPQLQQLSRSVQLPSVPYQQQNPNNQQPTAPYTGYPQQMQQSQFYPMNSQSNIQYQQQSQIGQQPGFQHQFSSGSYSQPNIPYQLQNPNYQQPPASYMGYPQPNIPYQHSAPAQYQHPNTSYSPSYPYQQQHQQNPAYQSLNLQYQNPSTSYSNIPYQAPPIAQPAQPLADPCTFMRTGREMVEQKFFTCVTCKFKNGTCMCENCARTCHAGHVVKALGIGKGYCDCGAGEIKCRCLCNNPSLIQPNHIPAFVPGPCTFNKTGEKHTNQPFYICKTCNADEGIGCCEFCARTCHNGHDVKFDGYVDGFCDCGTCLQPGYVLCKCVKIPNTRH